MEETPGTAGEELPRKSDSPDTRADIRQWAKEAAADKLAENQLSENPQLDEARERTPCTSAAVVETEQRRMPCLDKLIAEKPLAEKPQLAIPRKKT